MLSTRFLRHRLDFCDHSPWGFAFFFKFYLENPYSEKFSTFKNTLASLLCSFYPKIVAFYTRKVALFKIQHFAKIFKYPQALQFWEKLAWMYLSINFDFLYTPIKLIKSPWTPIIPKLQLIWQNLIYLLEHILLRFYKFGTTWILSTSIATTAQHS